MFPELFEASDEKIAFTIHDIDLNFSLEGVLQLFHFSHLSCHAEQQFYNQ
jgi:hypothetical protein